MADLERLALANALLARMQLRRIQIGDIVGVKTYRETSLGFEVRMGAEARKRARLDAEDLAEANRLIAKARTEQ